MYKPARRRKNSPYNNDISRRAGEADQSINVLCDLMKRAVNVTDTEAGRVYEGPKEYSTPEQLTDCFISYIDYIKESAERGAALIPDVEGFCSFAGVSRKRFLKMSDKADFYEVVQQILTAISQYKKQVAFAGGINPVILAMDLNNNHGYLGSNAVKIEASGPILTALPSKNDIIAALPLDNATDHGKTDQEPPKTGV